MTRDLNKFRTTPVTPPSQPEIDPEKKLGWFMLAIALAIFWAFALLATCSKADAAVPDGTIISPETVAPLARWVEKETHVPIHALPITIASGSKLKTALGLEGTQQARSVAAYIPGQIIINNIVWDEQSARAQSYMVHELKHHTDTLTGRKYACHNAKERDAYMLQNKWLAEHGEDPIYSQERIEQLSKCERDK